jgi:polyisoprenyl-teichoic acid--peptidoglycan teichoic acid transferase
VSVRRRAAFAVTALVAWVAGSALGTIGSVTPASAQVGVVIGKAHAGYAPSLTGSTPIVLLVVGSGARLGDDVTHSLADSIHVVSINPDKHKATIIGIPRDSWVDIPGNGSSKINASMVDGGPDLLVKTVESLSGLTIDYYALTTFWGVSQLYDNLGGLTMDVPFSMHDSYSGADFEPGVQTLDGDQVLAFSRDRHSLSGGDFSRSENAGRVLIASLAQFRKEFQSDQSLLFTWIASGMRNVQTTVPFDEIMALAYTCSHINPNGVTNIALPGSTGFEGSLSVVHLSSEKDAIFADLKPDAIVSKKNIPPSPTANET